MTATRPPEPLAILIETFIRERIAIADSGPLEFRMLSGGNSHVTWRVKGDATSDLVVKIAQPDGPLAPYNVAHEAGMMEQAFAAGVPAPSLVGVLQEGDVQFIVMRLVEGDSPSLWEVREWLKGRPDSDRIAIGRSLLSTLKPLAKASDSHESQSEIYKKYLNELIANMEQASAGIITLPASLRAAHAWLIKNIDAMSAPIALCHGDFRLGNAVLKDGSIAALLDWERAMPGHPLHDIGFLCLPGMKTGDHLCGVLTQQELAEIWEQQTGSPLDLRAVAYFKIVAIFGELCLMVRAMTRLANGNGRITGARPLPLVARLHHDLITSIRRWDNDDFAL